MTLLDRVASGARFFRRGIEDFDTTANFLASSRWLVDEMVAHVSPSTRVVVEFGPGTGVLTRALLDRLGPKGKLYAIELDRGLLDDTVRSLADDRLVGVHGSAADAVALLGPEVVGHADAVVSSLGLSLMDDPTRLGIMHAARDLLAPEAIFTQYAYVHARYVAYSAGRRSWFRWDARPFVRGLWGRVDESMVWANLPPALVFRCRHA